MSVIVMGMQMPKRCFECPIIDATDGFWCSAADKDLRKEHGINLSKPDWCPLRPLPEKHGRLIDGDELADGCDDPHWCRWLSEIEDMPTIVEAEGE